ncbi:MAG: redoxin domain-containing protein [Planctomycetes bacterium]|nr:redoxin domain-containing protein [Planctomycetota bacterium]
MTGARAAWLCSLLCGCAGAAPTILPDLDGRAQAPLTVAAGQLHVLFFVSQECPIANSYAPRIAELAAGWPGAVRTFVVHVDPDLTVAAATAHARDYALPAPILLDPAQSLATALGITHTPEVAVLTTGGLAYRGRIDDRWGDLGEKSQEPETHDLRDAVAALLADRTIATPRTEPVGCLLPEAQR